MWDKAHLYLSDAARSMKNDQLADAVDSAHKKGIVLNLNPDYKVVETDTNMEGHSIKDAKYLPLRIPIDIPPTE